MENLKYNKQTEQHSNPVYPLFIFNSYLSPHDQFYFALSPTVQIISVMPLNSKFILFFLPVGTMLDLVNTRSWRNFRRGRGFCFQCFLPALTLWLPLGSFLASWQLFCSCVQETQQCPPSSEFHWHPSGQLIRVVSPYPPVVSLSAVSVIHGQPSSENIKCKIPEINS